MEKFLITLFTYITETRSGCLYNENLRPQFSLTVEHVIRKKTLWTGTVTSFCSVTHDKNKSIFPSTFFKNSLHFLSSFLSGYIVISRAKKITQNHNSIGIRVYIFFRFIMKACRVNILTIVVYRKHMASGKIHSWLTDEKSWHV